MDPPFLIGRSTLGRDAKTLEPDDSHNIQLQHLQQSCCHQIVASLFTFAFIVLPI
jgi:hypothetical protein